MHLLTHSAILRALGWTLFNSLWQMGLLWIIYSVTTLLFRYWPARVRHGLLLLLLTAGTIWSMLTFVSAYWLSPGETYAFSSFLPQQGGLTFLASARGLAADLLPYCSTLYLVVLFTLLIRYVRRYLASRRLVRHGLSAAPPELTAFIRATARRMGIRPAVGVYLSGLVHVPVTLGFLKPLILLPVSMITRLTPGQIEAILVHELAHIRRQDYLIHLLTSVQELLFFFNPFTRLLIRQLRKEREHSCDDHVLQLRYDASTYVSALLSVARHHHECRLALAAVDGGEKLLLQRTRKILQQKRTEPRRGAGYFLLAFLTLGLITASLGLSRTASTRTASTRTIASRTAPATTAPRTTTPVTPALRTTTSTPPAVRTVPRPVASLETTTLIIRNSPLHKVTVASVKAAAPAAHTRHRHATQQGTTDLAAYQSYTVLTGDPDPAPAFAELVEVDDRDFSMEPAGSQNATVPAPANTTTGQPYVPASSFAFQYTDTLAPGQKLAMLQQQLDNKELCWQLARLQLILEQQKKLHREQQVTVREVLAEKGQPSMVKTLEDQQLKTLLQQEQALRQQYLKSLNDLQQQLKKAGRHLTIVYI